MPSGCEARTTAARVEDEDAFLDLPTVPQGIRLLGTPLGHPDFVRDQLTRLTTSHRVLLERIEAVPDLQVAWLLLAYCAATGQITCCAWCTLMLHVAFAERHDAEVWSCLH